MAAIWILSQWYLKVIGGLYLLGLGIHHLIKGEHVKQRTVRQWFGLSVFWSTVIAVEAADIIFSIDSIAAAVALSTKLWVLFLGGFLGILAMRFAAQGFVLLLERFPHLERAAFVAVAFIGLKMLVEFPGDVLGLTSPFPPQATPNTAAHYRIATDRHHRPWLEVPHCLAIHRAAAPPPAMVAFAQSPALTRALSLASPAERQLMQDALDAAFAATDTVTNPVAPASGTEGSLWGNYTIDTAKRREYRGAVTWWNLHHRALVELEGWFSSLIIMAIFAAGFIRRKAKAPPTSPLPDSPPRNPS